MRVYSYRGPTHAWVIIGLVEELVVLLVKLLVVFGVVASVIDPQDRLYYYRTIQWGSIVLACPGLE